MEKPKLNPSALSVADLVDVMRKAGTQVTAEEIEIDLRDGAPHNTDGTIHLVHYTAWLAKQAD